MLSQNGVMVVIGILGQAAVALGAGLIGSVSLPLDTRSLQDDVVVTAGVRAVPPQQITEPIMSPPVSLWEATGGLVSDAAEDHRVVEQALSRELERATRANLYRQ